MCRPRPVDMTQLGVRSKGIESGASKGRKVDMTSTSNVNSLPLIVPFSDLRKRSVVALTNVFAPTDRGAGTKG